MWSTLTKESRIEIAFFVIMTAAQLSMRLSTCRKSLPTSIFNVSINQLSV